MSIYFADTSAIAKRYLKETGSAWVQSWSIPAAGDTIIISRLTTVEFVSAAARILREGKINSSDFAAVRGAFLRHAEREYKVINLSKPVLVRARDFVATYALRTLDSVQLASALQAEKALGVPITFVSADQRLLAAATAEGFAVDDPNAHP